jgi:hypothetical protein
MADIIIYSGNAGELSPLLDGRSDLEKYYSGSRIYKNFIPLPYGPSERRPGTVFVSEIKDNDKKARLQSFQYSTEQAYIIEFGDQYVRFFKDQGQIQDGDGTENIDHLDNVIAHWLLNETIGTNVVDDDGATHDMTASVDAATLTQTGKVGTGCFDLDGQYDCELADHSDFSFTDNSNDTAFSIACWGYVTQQGSLQVLMSKWRDAGTTREWRFGLSSDRKLQLHLVDSSTNLTSDRVAQWFLNDDAATTAVDDNVASVPHDGVCSVNTDTINATGKINGALDFGGSVYATVSDHAALSFDDSGSNPFSIAAWIYVTTTGVEQMILSKWDTAKEEYFFSINSSGQLTFTMRDASAGTEQTAYVVAPLSTGWHFVVVTYDSRGGNGAADGLKLYIDGVFNSSGKIKVAPYTAMENLTADMLIGARLSGGSEEKFFADKLDNIVLFDIELTAANILGLWNGGNGMETMIGAEVSAVSDNAIATGWHFFCSTYSAPADESTAAAGIILYVDSLAVDSTNTEDGAYTAMQNGAEEIRIGSQRNAADGANENFWGDKIDEVSIYGDVLTPAEIAGLFTATPYEISSDYLQADLFKMQHAQSADVLFTVHGDYPQSRLTRMEHALWTLENIVFDRPPFLSENDTDTTITPSARIGTIELTASSSIFTSDMVGGYFLIKHPRTDNADTTTLTTDFTTFLSTGATGILVDVEGPFRLRTSATWTGTLQFKRTYDGELVLVLDSAPAGGAWEADDIITGGTSSETCIIVSVTDSTHYYIKQLSGEFTDGEILSNQSANSRDVAATYPRYEGWTQIDEVTSTQDQNFNNSYNETLGNAYLRVERSADSAGNDPKVTISVERYYSYGVVKITGYTSGTVVTGTVISLLGSTDATKLWSEGLWSDERGFPRTTAFYEGRQWFAGTDFRPLDIVGSVTNQYDNMKRGDLADDSVAFTVDSAQQNMIRWLVGEEILLIGTSGAEWKLGSYDPSDAITPTNPIKPRIQTTYGSKELNAILLANAVLFVDQQGTKVRGAQFIFEQGQAGSYDAPDYTLLSEHITKSGIVDMAFQQNPYPILWCVLANGRLVGMLFEPGQKVWGWFRCEIDGLVESVAVIPGTSEDEIWIIVKRTINSATKRYVEYFKPRDWGSDQADCFFVDSGLTFDGGAAVTITGVSLANPCVVTAANTFSENDQVKIVNVGGTVEINNKVYTVTNPTTTTFEIKDVVGSVQINSTGWTTYTSGGTAQQVENSFSGLDHLEGETVSVLGDGSVHPNVVVSSGAVVLTEYYNKVHIGLPFTSALQPMELALPGADIRGKQKRISKIIFSFFDSLGAKFGTTSGSETIPFRKVTDALGAPPPLFTGKKIQTFPGGYELAGDIYVEQTQPLPLTVRSITVKTGIYD